MQKTWINRIRKQNTCTVVTIPPAVVRAAGLEEDGTYEFIVIVDETKKQSLNNSDATPSTKSPFSIGSYFSLLLNNQKLALEG